MMVARLLLTKRAKFVQHIIGILERQSATSNTKIGADSLSRGRKFGATINYAQSKGKGIGAEARSDGK